MITYDGCTRVAANSPAWAIGTPQRNGFHVRRIVWGLLLAQHEVRDGEQIRAANITVEFEYKRRRKVARDPHL